MAAGIYCHPARRPRHRLRTPSVIRAATATLPGTMTHPFAAPLPAAARPLAPFTPASGPRLLGDIGGTHARFAWQSAPGAALTHVADLPTAAYPTLAQAASAYLQQGPRQPPQDAAIAMASPVTGDAVRMTNHGWSFSVAALRAELGLRHLRVLNDFTALALGLPDLPATALRPLGTGRAVPGKAIALIGAGTGLGVSGLLPDGRGGWVPLEGEGGHVTLPASSAREHAVLAVLARQYGHVSAERVLCGAGLLALYAALCELDGVAPARHDAASLSAQALQPGGDARALETLTLFCGWLGSIAGNLALTLGALGGVYIGGGIVPRWGAWLDASPLRARFEAKGRYASYLADVPVWVIQTEVSPALLGAARALDAGAWGVAA